MDRVLDSPFISLQPTQFTPHKTVVHFRQDEEPPEDPNAVSRVRRFHHKSRTGCKECKQKRRKCNEEKPSCQGCVRSKIECHYEESIPPRAQPKNRKRPQRKPGPSKFVFIEFGNDQNPSADYSSTKNALMPERSIRQSTWQSAPSTCLLQGGLHREVENERILPLAAEVECLDLFRSFTYRTLPMQFYNSKGWESITFEDTYSTSFLHNVIVAIACSHLRYLRKEQKRSQHELSCYVRSLETFRAAIASPSETANLDMRGWATTLVTGALLGQYIMSAPVDNLQSSFDTYFTLVKTSMSLLKDAATKGVSLPAAATASGTTSYEKDPSVTMYAFPGLEYAATGDDAAISKSNADRLAVILAVLTTKAKDEMDTLTAITLLKLSLEWFSMADVFLLRYFRVQSIKAYLIVAHYFAALWKIRDIIQDLCTRKLWQDSYGSSESFWWIQAAEGLCKAAMGRLKEEPVENISWVKDVIEELHGN